VCEHKHSRCVPDCRISWLVYLIIFTSSSIETADIVSFKWAKTDFVYSLPIPANHPPPYCLTNNVDKSAVSRSQWPRNLRPVSAVARSLGLRDRIPPRAWMPVSDECCVSPGRGLCVGLITHPEEYYSDWVSVCQCDQAQQYLLQLPWVGKRVPAKNSAVK